MAVLKESARSVVSGINNRFGRTRSSEVATYAADQVAPLTDVARVVLEAAPSVNQAVISGAMTALAVDTVYHHVQGAREFRLMRSLWTKRFWEEVAVEDAQAGIERSPSDYNIRVNDRDAVSYRRRSDRRRAIALMEEAHSMVANHRDATAQPRLDEEHAFANHGIPMASDLFRGTTLLYDSTAHERGDRLVHLEIKGGERDGNGNGENERQVDTIIDYYIWPKRFGPDIVYIDARETRMVAEIKGIVTRRAISVEEVAEMQRLALVRATAIDKDILAKELDIPESSDIIKEIPSVPALEHERIEPRENQ